MKRGGTLKRTPLLRRSPLRRTGLLRSRAKVRTVSPAERAWKLPRYGRCENCGLIDDRPLHGHHVIARPILRRADPTLEFDPRVRMDLCDTCHMNHEFGQANRKIAVEKIPERCLAFAVDLLGEAVAADQLRRHYRCQETR